MPIGFTQKHIDQIPLDDLTVEQFLSLAIEASNLLGWVMGNINKSGFIAYTNNGLFSWNAEVKLKIGNGSASVQSQSRGNNVIDLRENKKNIHNFVSAFKSLKKTITPEELESKYEKLKANFF